MDIKLYHNASQSNVVNKTITLVATLSNAKFLDPYDEYAPVIKLKGYTNFDNTNYVVITDTSQGSDNFTRAYFIESVDIKSPSIAILHLRMDVLMTFKDYILQMRCYLARSESNGDLYLPDNRPRRVYNNVSKLTFRDVQGNIEGFIRPGEDDTDQMNNGWYLITTIQDQYGSPE